MSKKGKGRLFSALGIGIFGIALAAAFIYVHTNVVDGAAAKGETLDNISTGSGTIIEKMEYDTAKDESSDEAGTETGSGTVIEKIEYNAVKDESSDEAGTETDAGTVIEKTEYNAAKDASLNEAGSGYELAP